MIEVRIQLQPKQKLFRQEIDTTPVTLYGGAKGGGKTHGLREIMLLRRFQYPNSIGKLFRRTYPELEDNHIRPLFQKHPALREYYNETKKLLTLPNGSTLEFCHCKNDADVFLYQGREMHDLAIDEAGQWTESMFRTLQGSNRSTLPGVQPRTLLTGNPGGVGHGWLKRIFIERRHNERENPADYAFVPALVDDNQALMDNDPSYVAKLEAEPNEALRKAYRYGDWDIFAGQFFSELTRGIHLIKPFPIPHHWNRFGSYDFGFNHPGGFAWLASDEDGNVYMYRELIQARLRVDQFADKINKFEDTKLLYPIVAGHDCWAKKHALINKDQPEPPTIAEEMAAHGIQLKGAVIDRISGAAQVRSYLALRDNAQGEKRPRFYIFDTCPITYDCLSRMIFDPDRPEDVLKVDATDGDPMTGDEGYDIVRYGLMSRPAITDPIVKPVVVGTLEWHKKMNQNLFDQAQEHFRKEQEENSGGWPGSIPS